MSVVHSLPHTTHLPVVPDCFSGMQRLDTPAFSTCANLRTVEIAEGCTHLGYRAFGNCKALEKITIPATVRQIGGECFLNCEKLTIHGKAGSYAQQYARGHGIPFCAE